MQEIRALGRRAHAVQQDLGSAADVTPLFEACEAVLGPVHCLVNNASMFEHDTAASFTLVPRSLASALSPTLGGALFAAGWMAAPLLACGGLKIAYDLLLWRSFRRIRTAS